MIQISDTSFLGQLLFNASIAEGGSTHLSDSMSEISELYFTEIIKAYFLPSMLPDVSVKLLEIENGGFPLIVEVLEQDKSNLSLKITSANSDASIEFIVSRPITESGTKFSAKIKIAGVLEDENYSIEARKLILFTLNHIRYFLGKNEH